MLGKFLQRHTLLQATLQSAPGEVERGASTRRRALLRPPVQARASVPLRRRVHGGEAVRRARQSLRWEILRAANLRAVFTFLRIS